MVCSAKLKNLSNLCVIELPFLRSYSFPQLSLLNQRLSKHSFLFHDNMKKSMKIMLHNLALSTACFLWSIFVFGNIMTVQFEMDNTLNALLDVTHSFYRIADSKFVGLAIFLIANVFTGIFYTILHLLFNSKFN
ncbi:hypothetical protein BpHYR1_005740 [Brachionus plicatilis]|uniref:Uncharacterized protein n=1 Tax=Brachionus plicatilis TaxID=10195 RepID=A0A3M7S273_BRAPC|nr:hypothetical protein BpHYR1_005740 [Brachionus plicatilis]